MGGKNPLGLRRLHHIEILAGNARQAAYYYRHAFGFAPLAYAGLETGTRDRTSYAIAQGKIQLLLTTPLGAAAPEAELLRRHGDAVYDVAFEVDDADRAFDFATSRGARGLVPPHTLSDDHGEVRHAAIGTYGDTRHSFFSNRDYQGVFLPGFAALPRGSDDQGAGLLLVDHVVGNVPHMQEWADYYARVMGFSRYLTFDDKDISTEYSALMSIVMADDGQSIKMPINEPAPGRCRSQIQEYLDYNGGPGVQHVALRTTDIVATVRRLRANGVEFLEVPDSYYETLDERVGPIPEDISAIRELRILVDRDDDGYLLQLFTKPVQDRPTLFFEVIEREGSRGFGKGNFKALFQAIELEQGRRGNL
jgi:4-hydroxyphenylpyruvate dioxygenase